MIYLVNIGVLAKWWISNNADAHDQNEDSSLKEDICQNGFIFRSSSLKNTVSREIIKYKRSQNDVSLPDQCLLDTYYMIFVERILIKTCLFNA